MWYTTERPRQKTTAEKAYEACDAKDIALIKKQCPETVVEGVTWYDTSTAGLEHEIKYLRLRGIIIIHPCHYLVRFP